MKTIFEHINEATKLDSITIEDEIISVGDKIQWYNKAINTRKQGLITSIDSTGIDVTTLKGGVKLKISAPYEGKEIFKIN